MNSDFVALHSPMVDPLDENEFDPRIVCRHCWKIAVDKSKAGYPCPPMAAEWAKFDVSPN